MIEPAHQELIDAFRFYAKDGKHCGFALVNDDEAKRLVAAWPMVPLDFDWPEGVTVPERTSASAWRKLWQATRIDLNSVCHYAALTIERAESALGVLKGARLIFPDGTISVIAEDILSKHVGKLPPKKKPEPKRKRTAK